MKNKKHTSARKNFMSMALSAALTVSFTSPLFLTAQANDQLPVWGNTDYQEHTPTIEQVLGYPAGSRISSPEQILHYYRALERAHPDQVNIETIGETWEGRSLVYVTISSAENIANLDNIKQGMQLLADPRKLNQREAEELISSLPSSIWIAASVHGNEISPAESAMVTAYHLLSEQSEQTQEILNNTVIYIDPLQNPDGRARFVSRYYATIGLEPSADRISAEHNEPWPNGRTNHYLFDMNRDWIALTQPETKARVAALQETFPLIFIDSHEMGGDMPYYFTPEAHPYNPFITESQREGLGWIGNHNADRFDEYGLDYFTREIFDAFYPGYGASWPLYFGSLAMTYEAGSARGHVFRTHEGEELTYGETVHRNFVAFMATIETASQRGEELKQRFFDYRNQGIEQGRQSEARTYIFPNNRDAAGHQKFASLLTEQGIEVHRANESFSACRVNYDQGALYVKASQPAYHLIRTLLDQNVPMDEDFIEEQERLRANNLRDQIYDVTAWSLPLLFNLDMDTCNREPSVAASLVSEQRIKPGSVTNSDASFGFVVPWGDMNAGRFLTAALREGLLVRSNDLEFTSYNGTEYPSGSLLVPRAGNPENLNQILAEIAVSSGATVTGLERSWTQEGPNAGSVNVKRHFAPNIAIAWDQPTSVLSAGSTRFIIERELNYPTTAIRPDRLAREDLSNYDVLILPATAGGNYNSALGEHGRENLRRWVEGGGVLITLGNATRFAISGETPLLDSTLERKAQVDHLADKPTDQPAPGTLISDNDDLQRYIRDPETNPDWVSGIIAKANVDQEHWLTAGLHETVHSMYIGNDIYTPLRITSGRNVMTFAGPDEVLASGYIWDENREQIAHKPLLMVQPNGRGMVISFTQEPNFRAYMEGMHVPLLNAVFRGAAHARPVR